jgi:hypothetical protein
LRERRDRDEEKGKGLRERIERGKRREEWRKMMGMDIERGE